jgi:RNA polymerase sigma-70 factor (ECF subfamily)
LTQRTNIFGTPKPSAPISGINEMASDTEGDRADTQEAKLRDADIVLRIEAAELTEAFDLIMQRYESKVYRLCLAFLRDRAQAQDAAQESLVRLWRALPKYDGRAALSTWIYAIARNWCLTCLSAKRRTVSLSESYVQAEVDMLAAPETQDVSDQAHALRQLVAELPEVTRRIVTLFYFEEQSVAQVSELIGLAQGTIKTHLFRARALMLARMESLGMANFENWVSGELT